MQDPQFLSRIELYLYASRLKAQSWETSENNKNAPLFEKSQIFTEISKWFNSHEEELLLIDYGKHNFRETGRLPMTYDKCRLWRRAYKRFLNWKQERELERIEAYVETV